MESKKGVYVNKRQIGAQKESMAADFLRKQGYEILEMNYRCRVGEIDIIAKHHETYVFVEVKYRSTNRLGMPVEAVDAHKQNTIRKVCGWYLAKKGLNDVPIRFDIVGILGEEILLYVNAF